MDDDIDYGALFGVTPDAGGQEPAVPEGQEPDVSNSGTTEESRESAAPEGAGQAPEGQSLGQSLDVSDSGTSPEQRAEGPEQKTDPSPHAPDGRPEGARSQGPLAQNQPSVPDEAAIARVREEAQRTIDEVFARSGLKNPYTGAPITSKAEYDAYRERFEAERREKILKQTGMSGEEFQQFVQELPEVRKAREAQEAAEKAVREAREAASRVKVEEQVREIGQMDPSIKSLEDLAKMPTYPRFYELVKRGNTLADAFRLANFDALTQGAAAGARQAAVNAARSKEHLEQTKTRGKGAVSVPADVREQYRLFIPDATDEEIQRHYQKNHKEG